MLSKHLGNTSDLYVLPSMPSKGLCTHREYPAYLGWPAEGVYMCVWVCVCVCVTQNIERPTLMEPWYDSKLQIQILISLPRSKHETWLSGFHTPTCQYHPSWRVCMENEEEAGRGVLHWLHLCRPHLTAESRKKLAREEKLGCWDLRLLGPHSGSPLPWSLALPCLSPRSVERPGPSPFDWFFAT